jgi:hypothetical protein
MPAANSIVATTTELLVDRAKQRLHAAWLQPGRRSMDRLAETIVDELAQSLAALHDFRLAQVCGVPPEGAPLLDQVQQIFTSLLPLGPGAGTAPTAQYSKPSAPASSAFG